MEPKLIALKGPLVGQTIPLDVEEITIGRESSNHIALSDAGVSRKHCELRIKDVVVTLTDLDSLNGTMVNRVPIKQRELQHQDQIEIGDSLFLFVAEGEVGRLSHIVEHCPTIWNSTELRREDSLYLQPDRAMSEAQSQQQVASNLRSLLRLTTGINNITTIRGLGKLLFEAIAETVPAEQGAILQEEPFQELSIVYGWNRAAGETSEVTASRTVLQQVLSAGAGLLSTDVREDESLAAAQSVAAAKVQSLLCVPMTAGSTAHGVLYLTSSEAAHRFEQDHLHLATAFAGVAAAAMDRILYLERLQTENRRLTEAIRGEQSMVGESAAMKEVYRLMARVAPADSTVLITGESGTGKELVAQAIHRNSARAGNALVSINCAALTETLLESELFGHEKGAFTGAIAQKKGKLEAAESGSVFLDEVAEMSPALQAKLLRVLQERRYERVGGTRTLTADVRFIAATNKDLKEAIKNNTFRQDLYYRLNVVGIHLPPLRERREDISLLANYFTAKYSEKLKRKLHGISAEARSLLIQYDWPGNVRELENAIERAVVLCVSDTILPEDLPESIVEREPESEVRLGKFHDVVTQTKKDLILHAVKQSNGNITEAAKLLGLHPNYLHRLIRNLNLRSSLQSSQIFDF